MTTTNSKLGTVLKVTLLILGGAVAWILFSAAQAGAITVSDQNSKTTNTGVGVANTGGNLAVGNDSTNTAKTTQDADASKGKNNSVAVNDGSASNNSDGSASIHTGNADATGNQSTTNNSQIVDNSSNKGAVLADQKDTTSNTGVGVANTGLNLAAGNVSTNKATLNQDANAKGGKSAIAVNTGDASNKSDGSASIVTGNANAVGNDSSTHTVQMVDAGSGKGFVLADQNQKTTNFGVGIANSGLNLVAGNVSTNKNNVNQSATASGSSDNVAVNDSSASNNSNGSGSIATGNANAVGNQADNDSVQVLNARATAPLRKGQTSAMPLLLLLALALGSRPLRRLAVRSR